MWNIALTELLATTFHVFMMKHIQQLFFGATRGCLIIIQFVIGVLYTLNLKLVVCLIPFCCFHDILLVLSWIWARE